MIAVYKYRYISSPWKMRGETAWFPSERHHGICRGVRLAWLLCIAVDGEATSWV